MKPNQDVLLKFKFTDRAGRNVYDVYPMPDGVDIMLSGDKLITELRSPADWNSDNDRSYRIVD